MSRYEWERGTILIPSDQWVAFRRKIIEAHNAEELRLFKLAEAVLATVKIQAKGKRGFDFERAIRDATGRCSTENRPYCDDSSAVSRLLGMQPTFVDGKYVMAKKPRSPKRKDLDLRPTSRGGLPMHGDEGTVTLNDVDRTVSWEVSENNRACERARAHPLGRALFAALDAVVWKRGSGGTIIGNDEYNRSDGDEEGRGGHYVTGQWGMSVARVKARTRHGAT